MVAEIMAAERNVKKSVGATGGPPTSIATAGGRPAGRPYISLSDDSTGFS